MRYLLLFLFYLITLNLYGQTNFFKAEHLYRQQQWEQAYTEYQKITQTNPFNGLYWYRLGFSAMRSQKYEDAIKAWKQATILFQHPSWAWYNLACTYALYNQPEQALQSLDKAIKAGYTDLQAIANDKDLENISRLPRFKILTQQKHHKFNSREEGWLADLQVLTQQFEQGHKYLFHDLKKEEWEQKKHHLKANLSHLQDYEIAFELMHLVAMVQDGHSNLFPFSNGQFSFHYLPLQMHLFEDGLHIKATLKGQENLLGAKILKIGEKSAEQLIQDSYQYIGRDNEMQLKATAPMILGLAEFYLKTNAVNSIDQIPMYCQWSDGKEAWVNIKPSDHPLVSSPMHSQHEIPWQYANQNSANSIPLYLQKPHLPYWYQYLPDEKIVYFQYNQVRNGHGENIVEFSKKLFHFIHQNEVEALIIDIRHNGGGNAFLNQPIIQEIIKCDKINQKGKLFTIIGRATFSAAMNFACDLEQDTQTLFVGEPTGSSPNNYGEHNAFRLPYSGLHGSYSNRYFQGGYTSNDHRPWIAPHLVAELQSSDFNNNIDPAMNTILSLLRNKN